MRVKVQAPPWQVGQLATFELRDYRSQLEHAIERAESPDREVLQARLTEVLNEQDTRAAAERADRSS